MSWTCPKGCHKENEGFVVMRSEHRTDTIVHFYSPNDGNLDNELYDPKVYVGDESDLDPPQCNVCESVVEWESEIGDG